MWCNTGAGLFRMPGSRKKSVKAKSPTRASVTFPSDPYVTLEDLARKKKVSLAWIVREAAEKYVADQWPPFAKGQLQ
jgi:hypothetical protein